MTKPLARPLPALSGVEVSLPKGETEKVECKDESFSKVPEPAEGTI